MFENKGMINFLFAAVFFFSIFIPGGIARLVCSVGIIVFLIIRIKHSKDTGIGIDTNIYDIGMIVLIVIINIALMGVGLYIDNATNNDDLAKQDSYEMVEKFVAQYKFENMDLFIDNKNHQAAIKKGFLSYLKGNFEIDDNNLVVNKNKITWKAVGQLGVIFTIEKNDITFELVEFKK